MVLCPIAWALPPVTAPKGLLIGFPQVYVVPAGTIFPLPLVGVTVKVAPEQMGGGISLVMLDLGFTVTVIVKVAPGHPPEVGVTV